MHTPVVVVVVVVVVVQQVEQIVTPVIAVHDCSTR
jgi:hypothetical protein